jgi:4-hydroxybenzoate polyprenyltransferase
MLALIRALRPLHWSKNLLVFIPVLLAHRFSDDEALEACILTFVTWCLVASGTYLINDVRDLAFDRSHPLKRHRLIASGKVSPVVAVIAGLTSISAGVALAASVSLEVLWFVLVYGATSISYSLALKRIVYLDVLILSALYVLRVLAGGVAAEVEVSDWLLALSLFFFLGLAILKRFADLGLLSAGDAAAGRAYFHSDRELLRSMGVTCSYLSVLVLALYLNGPDVARIYESPRLLWLVCPLLLYWLSHMWFLAERGRVQEDPIVAAVRDPASWVTGALVLVVATLAT